ncbi:MAG: esterase family protein [Prevotella sp.]|nr:esterase family protein [Prevotella sp.]
MTHKRLFISLCVMMTIMVGCAQSTDKAQAQSKSAKKQQSASVHDTIKAAKTAPQPKRTGKSRIVEGTYESAVLGAPRDYTIYLPKSYDVEPDRQYPILYLLHGMLDDNHCWVTRGGLQQVADELMAKGTCREMIIVTPCAGGEANKDWNGYFNMKGWAYETFFFDEFMPFIEKQYRVLTDRGHRAVAGLSMGGGGATSYAQRYPDLFCAVYAMSALMDIVPLPGHKAGPNSMVGLMSSKVGELSCSKFIRKASAQTIEKMKTIKWYVDCGNKDFLLKKNQEFMAAMDARGVPYKKQIRKGTHSWQYWHTGLYIMLPFISESMSD